MSYAINVLLQKALPFLAKSRHLSIGCENLHLCTLCIKFVTKTSSVLTYLLWKAHGMIVMVRQQIPLYQGPEGVKMHIFTSFSESLSVRGKPVAVAVHYRMSSLSYETGLDESICEK